METRKVQQVGGGTYTVSIPISWANDHGIEAGGTAYLYTHRDGSLVVRWGEQEETALAAVEIAVDDADGAGAARLLDAAYTAGFDRISLRATDGLTDSQRESITARARTLVGVDVASETETEVTVRWLLDGSDLSVRQSVRQLRFVAASMHDAAMATFTGATAEAGYIVDRIDEADRLARLVERQCGRTMVSFEALDRLDTTRAQLFTQYRIARELECLATDAAEIARAVRRAGPAESTELATDVRAAGVAAREAVEAATDAALDGGSAASVHAALDDAAAVLDEVQRLLRAVAAAEPADPVLLTRVLDRVRSTAHTAESVGEIALEGTVRP